MAKLGERLKAYRQDKNLTQKDLADLLGVTQVHISRVEQGSANLSKNLEARILSIIGDIGQGFGFKLSVLNDECWNYASFTYGDNTSGDRVRLNAKGFADRTCLLHCDATGHDLVAKYMADNLVIGFEAVLGAIQNELFCSSEYIYKSMNQMAKNSKDFWRGEPSGNFFVLNRESREVSLLNAGMPSVWLMKKGAREVEIVDGIKWPPIGNLGRRISPYSNKIRIEQGDTLFSFSDGFADEFEKHSTINLKTHVSSISRALKGDAEGIGTKLLNTLDEALRGSIIEDNISFVIISKI